MTDQQWAPDVRPVIPELENDFEHDTYPPAPVHFVPILEKLDDPATRAKLLELARAVV
jgi:hypothetical protein